MLKKLTQTGKSRKLLIDRSAGYDICELNCMAHCIDDMVPKNSLMDNLNVG